MKVRENSFRHVEDLIKAEMPRGSYGCTTFWEQILKSTGHIPVSTNIARGAGYCTFYARLSETIGIKKFFSEHSVDYYSGKGIPVHNILGLASLDLFPGIPTERDIADKISKVIESEELKLILSKNRTFINKKDETKELAIRLMTLFVKNLTDISNLLEVSPDTLEPIVEQQFLDYDLHIRGIPDLILEDKKKGKAIVVDWKTFGGAEMDYEKAQVVAYSLLEASRLGYDNPYSAVLGKVVESKPSIDVVPVIVKLSQNAKLGPHPFLSNDFGEDSLRDFSYMIDDVQLEAEHLTALLANSNSITGGKKTQICDVVKQWGGKTYNINLLKWTPPQLNRGHPKTQNTWPCVTKNNKRFCNLEGQNGPCKFYFGKDLFTNDNVEKDMWRLRYNVFDTKESSLLVYRGIYDIFKTYRPGANELETDAIKHIQEGKGFFFHVGGYSTKSEEVPQIVIMKPPPDNSSGRIRIDSLDQIIQMDTSHGFQMRGSRKLRGFELRDGINFVISSGRTALITIMDSWNPLLSISAFVRINEVQALEDHVEYVLDTPSSILNYQLFLFMKYVERNKDHCHLLMFEVTADLTQMELNSIDALQRRLVLRPGDEPETFYLDRDEIQKEADIEREINEESSDKEELDNLEDTEKEGILDVLQQIAYRSSRKL